MGGTGTTTGLDRTGLDRSRCRDDARRSGHPAGVQSHIVDEDGLDGLGLDWRDLAHWAIYDAVTDPDRSVQTGNAICRSRYLHLENGSGQVHREQIFEVVYDVQTGHVVTLTPTTSQCTR